jgi:tetratricopeptide (TPR) repeat protein
MEVISWLGVWYVKGELYEDAIQFFERAAEIEPNEVKWQLMVASCYRRMGSYTQALTLYKKIHKQYPENLECNHYHSQIYIPCLFVCMSVCVGLRYLCNICKDVNDSSYEEYSKLLKKAERAAASKDSRYMRDDMKEQMAVAKSGTGAMDTPSTSPTPHGAHKPLSPLR